MDITTLGLVSTALEAVGLTLAFLDMRLPKTMKIVEDAIDKAGDDLHNYSHKNHTKVWFQASLSVMIAAVLIVGVGALFQAAIFPIWAWVIFWVSLGLGSSIIIVALLGDFIALLNRFSVYDQAVTTLGFFLATAGLLIEVGQLLGLF